MNRAHANAREDTTELERVVCELEQVIESIVTERYERIPNMGAAIKEVCTDALKSYAQSVAEEAVREARRSVLEIAKPGTLYQTADPNPTTRSGKANEMVNKEMEEQVEELISVMAEQMEQTDLIHLQVELLVEVEVEVFMFILEEMVQFM